MNRYKTQGVCSRHIDFSVDENGIITVCIFEGGCAGNTQGLSRLVAGRHIDEVIDLLEGIKCRPTTSCPDQLAKALKEYKISHNL